MPTPLQTIFERAYRELRPRAPLPEFHVSFYHFTGINNTIRLRDGKVYARVSDLLAGAPDAILNAIAHILVAKLYRKPIDRAAATRYRRYISAHDFTQQAQRVRQVRGRKKIIASKGHCYDLEAIFEDLNRRFFYGLMARPLLTWSTSASRQSLGHYDPAHNTIVVSKIFDHPTVPKFAIEYLVYHEMLHLRHPVKLRGSRRCVHSREFVAEEKLFPEFDRAKAFLKRL